MNRLSHGFTSSVLFIAGEKPEDFNLLLADLHNEFQPATPTEQIILEKMVHHQWFSLRACRLQSVALNSSSAASTGYMPPDLGVLIRYQQSSERGFYKARTELLTARKEREKSEIRFESQGASGAAAEPQNAPAEPPKPPDPPREAAPKPNLSVPVPPKWYDFDAFDSLDEHLEAMTHGPDGDLWKKEIDAWRARRKSA